MEENNKTIGGNKTMKAQNFGFMKEMIPRILDGGKRLTNRVASDFRWKLDKGGIMHCFTGLRTKNCVKVADAEVKRRAFWHPDWIPDRCGIKDHTPMFPTLTWEQFARMDGFDDFKDFNVYFQHKRYKEKGILCYAFALTEVFINE